MYVRRFEGETNTRVTIVLDASASMGFGSKGITKLQYGKFLAAAFAYLAARQHDPVGLIVFDEVIRQYRPPTSRAGSLSGLIHAIDSVQAGHATDLVGCFQRFREHLQRRGLVVVISDLYCDPEAMSKAVQPLAYGGHDIVLFQLLDPQERNPQWRESVVLEDMETQRSISIAPEYLSERYTQRLEGHIAALKVAAAKARAHQVLIDTNEPLNRALRGYLLMREGRR
jgi:uncharacterized protein (DUF58 family)